MKKIGVVYVDQEYCSGCGICIEFCPQNVLVFSATTNHKGVQVVDIVSAEECTACFLCELYCPNFAIAVEEKVQT